MEYSSYIWSDKISFIVYLIYERRISSLFTLWLVQKYVKSWENIVVLTDWCEVTRPRHAKCILHAGAKAENTSLRWTMIFLSVAIKVVTPNGLTDNVTMVSSIELLALQSAHRKINDKIREKQRMKYLFHFVSGKCHPHTVHMAVVTSQPFWIRWMSEISLVPSSVCHEFSNITGSIRTHENWNQCSWRSVIISSQFFFLFAVLCVRLYCGCCNYMPCHRMWTGCVVRMWSASLRLPFLILYATLSIGFSPYNVLCLLQTKTEWAKSFLITILRCCRWDWHHMRPRSLFHWKTHATARLHRTTTHDTFAASTRPKKFPMLFANPSRASGFRLSGSVHTMTMMISATLLSVNYQLCQQWTEKEVHCHRNQWKCRGLFHSVAELKPVSAECHMCRGRASVTVWCVSFHNCIE